MQPAFRPPKDEEEFKRRASAITAGQARSMIQVLTSKRDAVARPYDMEIAFYQQVLDSKQTA